VGIKGQISLEYIIITGFVLVVLLVPAFILLFSTTTDDIYSKVNTQKINDLGNGLIDDARQMYYLGIYSHKVTSYQTPQGAEDIYLLKITNEDKIFYYIGIVLDGKEGQKVYNFQSDIPIATDIDDYEDIDTLEEMADIASYVNECNSVDCEALKFKKNYVTQGKKDIKTEIVLANEDAVARIYPIVYS
jgi:hypothetical protein